MALIELKEISKRYGSDEEPFYAARDVNLKIEEGDFIAIMGPSGSGKSTVMHLMGLLDLPSSGEVWMDGIYTTECSEEEIARIRNEKIGFVFQSFNLLPRTSALDNVALPLAYAAKKQANVMERAAQMLSRVGLDPIAKGANHPSQLSGGQQQRVAIARALMMNPSIILADEPTGNLDSKSTDEILALFQKLNNEGTTIVVVTHDEYVGQHAKKIIRFLDGRNEREEMVTNRIYAREGNV